jgi:hypothetical protein
MLLQDGSTPLHFAAWKGHTEVVGQLLDAGADMDIADMVKPPLKFRCTREWLHRAHVLPDVWTGEGWGGGGRLTGSAHGRLLQRHG